MTLSPSRPALPPVLPPLRASAVLRAERVSALAVWQSLPPSVLTLLNACERDGLRVGMRPRRDAAGHIIGVEFGAAALAASWAEATAPAGRDGVRYWLYATAVPPFGRRVARLVTLAADVAPAPTHPGADGAPLPLEGELDPETGDVTPWAQGAAAGEDRDAPAADRAHVLAHTAHPLAEMEAA